jgi:hypothetical protein
LICTLIFGAHRNSSHSLVNKNDGNEEDSRTIFGLATYLNYQILSQHPPTPLCLRKTISLSNVISISSSISSPKQKKNYRVAANKSGPWRPRGRAKCSIAMRRLLHAPRTPFPPLNSDMDTVFLAPAAPRSRLEPHSLSPLSPFARRKVGRKMDRRSMRPHHTPARCTVLLHHRLFWGPGGLPGSLFFGGGTGEEFLGLLEDGGGFFLWGGGLGGLLVGGGGGLGGVFGVFEGVGGGGVGVGRGGVGLAWRGHCEGRSGGDGGDGGDELVGYGWVWMDGVVR